MNKNEGPKTPDISLEDGHQSSSDLPVKQWRQLLALGGLHPELDIADVVDRRRGDDSNKGMPSPKKR